jgi:hypothetical protein
MRFTDLKSKQATLVETHIKQSSLLLENACIGLTKKQKQIVEGIHTEFKPLIEASLTVDQIQGLFGNIEQTATAGGDNRTLVGKGKDTVAKVNDIINKAGKWVQDTTPVKGFDNKFEQLKTSVGEKFPELDKQLTSMGTWAKENPGKTAVIIGVLTSLATLAGGPVGGAIAGQVLRGTTELMKGEKLSTAVGKGLKTAALGWLTGLAMQELTDLVTTDLKTQALQDGYYSTVTKSKNFQYQFGTFYGTKEDSTTFRKLWNAASNAWDSNDPMKAAELFNKARDFAGSAQVQDNLANLHDQADAAKEALDKLQDTMAGLSAAAQGAVTGASANEPKQESYSLSETDLRRLWVGVSMMSETSQTNEGPKDALKFVGDKAKQAAGAAASKVADVGKNLTTKVTASKLAAAWEKAGKPTEDIAVHEFLVSQGIEASTVDNAFKSAKLKVPQVPNVKVAELTKLIKGLPQEQFAQLKQQIIDKYNKLQGQPA